MPLYDSQDLARRVKLRLNRPATDAAFTVTTTDDVIYDFLTEAQDRVTKLLASYVPGALWTVPTLLTSDDEGMTYGFGADTDGDSIFALGHFKVYETEAHIPDYPLLPGIDFQVEGTVLRILPGTQARSFSDGPYVQYVAPSNVITSATQPTVPKIARPCLIADAARRAAERLKDGPKAEEQAAQFDADWLEVLTAVRTRAYGAGEIARPQRSRTWASGRMRW